MAILYDDDFQGYALGAGPPYGQLVYFSGTSPVIINSVTGIFGAAQEVNMLSATLLFPDGVIGPLLPVHSEATVFMGYFGSNAGGNQLQGLLTFVSFANPFGAIQIAEVCIYADGTIGIATPFFTTGQIPVAISNFSLLQNKWYWLQINITFSSVTGFVNVVCEVAVNGISVVSCNVTTGIPVSSLPVQFWNAILLSGQSMGKLIISDTVLAIGADPDASVSNDAQISQGVIELALSPGVPLVVACPINNQAILGSPYMGQIIASGGTPPYTYAIVGGALPTGLTLDPATGIISGTPTELGSFTFQFQVTDSQGVESDATTCAAPTSGIVVTQCASTESPLSAFNQPPISYAGAATPETADPVKSQL